MALGALIQEVRRRGLPRHIEGKIEAVQDMIELVMGVMTNLMSGRSPTETPKQLGTGFYPPSPRMASSDP